MKKLLNRLSAYWPEGSLGLFIVAEIFFRLGRAAILSDDATYAFRSIRLVDFMASGNQTTPWQWFQVLPWWINLSFHDAPPLFFWLEHLVFTIFGVNSFSASLLPAVGGCLSALMVYLLIRLYFGRRRALIALVVLSCLNPFIWLHRIALLESLMTPLVLVTWYAYVRAEQDKRWYWLVGIAGGLALMSKYTAIFLVLAILIHLSWKRARDWRSAYWWRAIIVAFLIISPVILYNYFLWLTRGHFDVQLAAAFGQSNSDWPILTTRINKDIFNSLGQLLFSLGSLYSWPVLIVTLWSLFRLVHYRQPKLSISSQSWFTIIASLCWLLVIILTRSNDRFIATGYIFPILLIAAAFPDTRWRDWTWKQGVYVSVTGIVLLSSWLYLVNTNYLNKPWGRVNTNFSDSRRENYGLSEVESTLDQAFKGRKPILVLVDNLFLQFDPQQRNEKLFDPETIPLAQNDQEAAPVVIYDRNINWFVSLWYFYRWSFYDGQAVLHTVEAGRLLADPSNEFINAVKGRKYLLFMTTDFSSRDSVKYQSATPEIILQLQQKSQMKYLVDSSGRPVLELYWGQF